MQKRYAGWLSKALIVTLATGRMFLSAQKYAKQIGLTAPLVVYNGAMIRAAGAEKPLYFFPLPGDAVSAVLSCTYKRGWYIQLYNDDCIVVDRQVRETRIDPDLQNAPCAERRDLRRACLGPTPKLMTAAEPAEIAGERPCCISSWGTGFTSPHPSLAFWKGWSAMSTKSILWIFYVSITD